MVYNLCHLIGQPNIKLQPNDIKYLIILTIVGSYVRLYMLNSPSGPVYQEVYTGKRISKELHVDRHPPYALMLYSLIASIFKAYLNSNVSYISMRFFSAIFGIFLIPVTFFTLKVMKFTRNTAIFGSMLIIFENSIITQSRFLFVDSLVLFLIALTHLFWRLFENYQQFSFKKTWWMYLIATGFTLGALISTNWLGIFTLVWIGVLGSLQLWHFIGDLTITPNVPSLVRYGSKVTIRHFGSSGGYLHSHPHLYPAGSKQQQVTLYLYEDINNDWLITDSGHDSLESSSSILDGSIVRLYHLETDKRLHSHDIRPSLSDTDWQNEVSGYGYKGFVGDNNDLFKIEIDKSRSYTQESKISVRAIQTRFRLIHVSTGCALFSNDINLPAWGYGQIEVTCAKNGIVENSLWYIENNSHDDFPNDTEKVTYRKINFFQKFWELQRSIWKKKFESTNFYASNNHPLSWPFLKRGIRFWTENDKQIYFLGNPLIWWVGLVFIGIYIILKLFNILRDQRGYPKCNDKTRLKYDYLIGTILIGWVFHYLPFCFMKTQFILYNYVPSLYFSILSFCSFWDYITIRFFQKSQTKLLTLFFLKIVISIYFILSPLVYGSIMRKEHCNFIKFLKTWDLDYLSKEKLHLASIFGRRHIGNVEISPKILKNIENIIENSSKPSIRLSVMKMYASLKDSQTIKNKFSTIDTDAYLFGVMPRVYASLYNVINELRTKLGNKWIPETVLDCGIGPGIGALVFQELFSDFIEKVKDILVIEPAYIMRKRAFDIHKGNKSKILSNIPSTLDFKFDFIIANHMILDINTPDHIFCAHIKKLWDKLSSKGGILLLLERGNPMGYEAVARARQMILSGFNYTLKDSESIEIGHVISPCSHDKKCPLYTNGHLFNRKRWCHFSQRLIRPEYLRKIKHSSYNVEDAKYSYCIIRKGICRPNLKELKTNSKEDILFYDSYNWPRLILPPLKKHRHVIMDLCTSNGTIQRLIIPKSQGKIVYRDARKIHWGDLWALGSNF
ncbi:hypothetical protein PMAC_000654 [Pneumocystis sp. 'macacae']|nr:hypothetical protein PMAC_000654 [Pneumocystis sp. 'macacae']